MLKILTTPKLVASLLSKAKPCFSSGEDMDKDVLTINQNDVDSTHIKISLVNNQELRVVRKKHFSTEEYRVNILVLNEKSKRIISFGWKWFLAGLITSLLLLPKSIHLSLMPGLYLEIAFYAGLIISIYCFYMTWETTTLRQLFYSHSTNIPIVELAVDKPSKSEFDAFLKKTEESIKTYREKMNIDPNRQLTGEIKTLRRLNKIGVISNPDYESSKSVLLSQM